ncbi:hypothetical protein GCM10010517_59320 [Streptosporangium fragile]|uniref:Uncharacterized protein n=1 Tax=Streptosporangium fragile TaxID=46186 RepID=A0ABP6IL01_9ACTN
MPRDTVASLTMDRSVRLRIGHYLDGTALPRIGHYLDGTALPRVG